MFPFATQGRGMISLFRRGAKLIVPREGGESELFALYGCEITVRSAKNYFLSPRRGAKNKYFIPQVPKDQG